MNHGDEAHIDTATKLANQTLFDAVKALGKSQQKSLILVGAQAIYHHIGVDDLAIPQFTTDADIVLDPSLISDNPRIDESLEQAGFTRTPPKNSQKSIQPGQWYKHQEDGASLQVDLIIPRYVAEKDMKVGRRSAHKHPHDKNSFSTAKGLEAALVDNLIQEIKPLTDNTVAPIKLRVAGKAALLIAKAHKIGERVKENKRVQNKDAYDIYRLLRSSDTTEIRKKIIELNLNVVCKRSVQEGIVFLSELYSDQYAKGPQMTGEAEGVSGQELMNTQLRAAALVQSVL